MAAAVAGAGRTMAVTSPTVSLIVLPKRYVSSSSHPPLLFTHRLLVQPSPPHAIRFTPTRCWTNRLADSYWPANSRYNIRGPPPAEVAPLFSGSDNGRWLILMRKPGGEGATTREMIRAYIQTLAKVVGSELVAENKIYKVSCERYFGFGCEIDKETSNKLRDLPGILVVLPDPYSNDRGGTGDRAICGPLIPKWYLRGGLSEMKKKLKQVSSLVEQLEMFSHG